MKKIPHLQKDNHRRGIYILPNLFTTLNIFAGFFSVIAAIDGDFYKSAIAIILAILFDILDGKIARATHTTSKFGVEYDSLADLISFGFAPGIMMYLWALEPLGRIGWLAAFLFMVCGALRLARFNSKTTTAPSQYFMGLPIPAGAGMNATFLLILLRCDVDPGSNLIRALILVMLCVLAFLMVSTLRYNSFKKATFLKNGNFNILVSMVLVFIFIAAKPYIALFMIAVIYVCSGPFNSIRLAMKKEYQNAELH
jgi:CDP-diacylglycerol--serine O-phosphatidyltransferase